MKLLWKLAVPQILIVVCFGLASFFVINSSLNRLREEYVRDVIESRFHFINKEVEASSQRAVSEASVFVRLPAVIRAYEIALGGDIDDPHSPESRTARELLRRELAVMLDSYSEQTGKKLELHFHLPNGRSLVRLWREVNAKDENGEWADISDDLRAFRPTVLEANETGRTALGIEVGSGGFAIRGVVPVFAPDGTQLGTAESLQQFEPILETAAEEGKTHIALYANKELLDFSVELRDQDMHPPIGDFVKVVGAKDSVIDALVTAELLAGGKEGARFESLRSITLATLPLADYRGRQVGVIVCGMDTTAFSVLVSTASVVLAFMLACMVTVPAFALLRLLRKLVLRPLGVVEAKIRDIAEDRADLCERIPVRQKDEIGDLARRFNTLTAKLHGILAERQEMFGALHSESVKYETMAHWYKSILDATPYPITVTDANMNWTFVNRAVQDFLGTSLEEMVGKPCSNWNAPICNTDDCGIACAKRGLMRTYFTQKGRSHQVDVEVLKDRSGAVAGFIEVVQDITELEEMHKKQADAEAANRAKSNFLANMSHEIRSPLNAIIGMTAIAEAANNIGKKDYAIRKIKDASSHLLGVISDVLDMSKIEAEKFELSPVGFDFEKMLQKVVNVIRFRVDERRQRLTVGVGKDIPRFLIGDDQRLAQVIVNLLSNAVKFTPDEGSIRLDSRLMSGDAGLCWLQISVTDTGIGIAEEQKARLFQSFEQAEADTTRKYGGTGLGLAISRRIVELMGGRIWFESEVGKGSTFSFSVALMRDAAWAKQAPVKTAGWDRIRVFAVDGDPEIRGLYTDTFSELGISCVVASSGAEAAEKLSLDDRFDLCFIDWNLPEMSGIRIARLIRRSPSRDPLIVFVTSAEWSAIEPEIRGAGGDTYLQKPLFRSDITDVLNTCASAGAAAEVSEKDREAADFAGHTILLVEDMEINREIVLTLLEPTRLAVECAKNGEQAVRMYREAPDRYGLIFMDLQMPEMDGYAATRAIRSIGGDRARAVPIIAMTANVFREDVEKCLEAGMNGHVGKPIDLEEVIGILRRYLLEPGLPGTEIHGL